MASSPSPLRASVTASSATDVGGPVTILVDGSDTPITANGLSEYTPTPGDRLLVARVGGQVEVLQYLSRGTVPYVTGEDLTVVQQEAAAAQATADAAQTTATNAQASANGKNTIYYGSAAPVAPAGGFKVDDTWFKDLADGGVEIDSWDGTAWVSQSVSGVTLTPGSVTETQLKATVNQAISDANTAAANATTAANAAQTTADGKNKVSVQTTAPANPIANDVWIDTGNGNVIKTWSGTAWQTRQDAAIATAQSAAVTAQTSANGKNTIYYTTPVAPAGGFKAGDTWFDSANGNQIKTWNGTAWVALPLGAPGIADAAITNAKIANLDAAKITTGLLDAARINAQSITVDKLSVGGRTGTELVVNSSLQDNAVASGWVFGGTPIAYQQYRSDYPGGVTIVIPSVNGTYGQAQSPVFPVTAGESYGLSVEAAYVGTIPSGLLYRIRWFDSTGALLPAYSDQGFTAVNSATPGPNQFGPDATTRWTLTWDVVAPTGAVSGTIWLFNYPANTGTNTSYILINNPSVRKKIRGNLIVDGAINTAQLAADAVTATQILAGQVIAGKLAGNSVVASNIAGKQISAAQMVSGTITAASGIIGNLAIGTAQIIDGAISSAKIGNLAVGTAHIQDGAITNAKIGTLDAGKITTGTLNAITITGSTITGSQLNTPADSNGNYLSIINNFIDFLAGGGATNYGNISGSSYGLQVSSGSNAASLTLLNNTLTLEADSTATFHTFDGDITIFAGYGGTAGARNLYLEASNRVVSSRIYNSTITSAANVAVISSGSIYRSTSLRKAKLAIDTLTVDDVRPILDIPTSTWFDRTNTEMYADYLTDPKGHPDGATAEPLQRIPGVVAEDVEPLMPLLVTYDQNGELNGVAYDRIGALLIPLVKELTDRVTALEAQDGGPDQATGGGARRG